MVGLLPYFLLPAQLRSAQMPAMYPEPGETAVAFAERVRAAMQERLDTLAAE